MWYDDPTLITDLGLLALLLIANWLGNVIYRRTVGRLPPQQPGDVVGLGRGLATLGCATATSISLICAVGLLALAVWSQR